MYRILNKNASIYSLYLVFNIRKIFHVVSYMMTHFYLNFIRFHTEDEFTTRIYLLITSDKQNWRLIYIFTNSTKTIFLFHAVFMNSVLVLMKILQKVTKFFLVFLNCECYLVIFSQI